ncbi:MAG TPA: hypothetical protein VFM68_03245 [Candidatus Saccharimonadales bacterium]|nr:hypothetical protein [Candidatus Saccharimonadales bacterium]
MYKFKNTIRVCFIYTAALLLAGGYPLTAAAQQAAPTPPPRTTQQEPVEPERTYTYNEETKRWDSDKWQYNPATGRYEAVPPPPAPVQSAPVTTHQPPATSQNTTTDQAADASKTIDATTNTTIDNNLNSDAQTGDATVTRNTTAGDAGTGDASAVATIMNTINSSVGGDGAEFASFVSDVNGDVHGDIMLYPMLLKAMLDAANDPASTADTTINASTSSTITNDVDLNASSGDAAVTNNTNAGSATTGTANTVANVMNIINSIIAANQSFVGTINIHGNLDGDILVAPDFLPELLASNTGTPSAPAGSLEVTSENMQSIVNNVNLNAASGDAVVANNTNAGSATTGDASTNVVILNLSGHQVVASNSLLVFVNVLGEWVGIIVDAPTGATAAALGNGVTSHTSTSPDLTINAENNSQIVNNINLNSQSGDATVASNTNAGNATTGDATASANIANISGSQMGVSDWFGILFINVFGSWYGSFGVDTERGNQPPAASGGGTPNKPDQKPASNQVFQFIADSPADTTDASLLSTAPLLNNIATAVTQQAVVPPADTDKESEILGVASTSTDTTANIPVAPSEPETASNLLPLLTGAFLIGLGVIATKNIIAFIRGRGGIIS